MNFTSYFSIPEDIIYLNSGTMAFSPRSVIDAAAKYKKEIEDNPAQGLFTAWPKMWAAQKDLASFINADPKNLFLRPNVTIAMNDFLMALKIPKGSEILISDLEYGAVAHICRYKAETEGHSIKVLHIPARGPQFHALTVDDLLKLFEKALTHKTKLVMFSHVMTGSGFVLPVEKIAEICRAKKIFFVVDGAHGAGALPLDFSKTSIDFYGSNLHKWMMGPKGTGFAYVAPNVREFLEPRFAGWTTYDVQPHFQVFGDGDPWTCRWMICSTHNFSDYYAISDVVKFWKSCGPDQIWGRQKELRDFTQRVVGEKTGWTSLSSGPDSHSEFSGPMVVFELPDQLAQRGFELIFTMSEKHKLQISMTQIQGRWCLRLAPHIYNSEEEIEKAATILAK